MLQKNLLTPRFPVPHVTLALYPPTQVWPLWSLVASICTLWNTKPLFFSSSFSVQAWISKPRRRNFWLHVEGTSLPNSSSHRLSLGPSPGPAIYPEDRVTLSPGFCQSLGSAWCLRDPYQDGLISIPALEQNLLTLKAFQGRKANRVSHSITSSCQVEAGQPHVRVIMTWGDLSGQTQGHTE